MAHVIDEKLASRRRCFFSSPETRLIGGVGRGGGGAIGLFLAEFPSRRIKCILNALRKHDIRSRTNYYYISRPNKSNIRLMC